MTDHARQWEEIADDAHLSLQDQPVEDVLHLFDVDPDTPARLTPAGIVLELMAAPFDPGDDWQNASAYTRVYDHIFQLALDPRLLAADLRVYTNEYRSICDEIDAIIDELGVPPPPRKYRGGVRSTQDHP
ncbi:MAG: hypothetical protein K1X95_03200 [Acidimicrobiia bacterium]|nr:hypothetical protein [Acidimicrobiia bacterium]